MISQREQQLYLFLGAIVTNIGVLALLVLTKSHKSQPLNMENLIFWLSLNLNFFSLASIIFLSSQAFYLTVGSALFLRLLAFTVIDPFAVIMLMIIEGLIFIPLALIIVSIERIKKKENIYLSLMPLASLIIFIIITNQKAFNFSDIFHHFVFDFPEIAYQVPLIVFLIEIIVTFIIVRTR